MQIERRITAIRERYVDDASLNNALLSEADWYSKLFGEGNFYIELQYHGLEIEKAAYPKLAWVAQMTGLPVVAANDAHIPDNSAGFRVSQGDRPVHKIPVRALVYAGRGGLRSLRKG